MTNSRQGGASARAFPQVAAGFYDALLRATKSSPFLSPCGDRRYIGALGRWITSCGGDVVEVGPGYGELVAEIARQAARISSLTIVDSSAEALSRCRTAWPAHAPAPLHVRRANLDDPSWETNKISLTASRVVAINVLQDVDLVTGLSRLKSMMEPGGALRVTVLAKEPMDALYGHCALYEPEAGLYLQPIVPQHGVDLPWLGEVTVGGRTTAYCRVLRFASHNGLREAFSKCRLHIYRLGEISYPAEAMIHRWERHGTLSLLDQDALRRMRRTGRYVDAYEVFARHA